jgi:hypothetical protein
LLCSSPYLNKETGLLHGCGQCRACRINRRRIWTHRLMLEAKSHKFSSFITLTYTDDYLPKFKSYYVSTRASKRVLHGGCLFPRDVTLFLKRLRRRVSPVKLKYYVVGEYGDENLRPHYHLALFGFPSCVHGRPNIIRRPGRDPRQCDCDNCQIIQKTWDMGLTFNGTLTKDSAQYVASYVLKKMTSSIDERLLGRYPEFARCSQGLGLLTLNELFRFLQTDRGLDYIAENGDVPNILNHGGKSYPLGRYLKEKLRDQLGFSSSGTPEHLLKLLEDERRKEKIDDLGSLNWRYSDWDYYMMKNKQKIKQQSKKLDIFTKGRKL